MPGDEFLNIKQKLINFTYISTFKSLTFRSDAFYLSFTPSPLDIKVIFEYFLQNLHDNTLVINKIVNIYIVDSCLSAFFLYTIP